MNARTPTPHSTTQPIGLGQTSRHWTSIYRRILGVVAIALLAVALVACGGGDDENDEPGPVGTVPAGPDGNVPTSTPLPTAPDPTIVTGDGTGVEGPGGPGNGAGSAVTYTVEPGESLSVISANFGVTVEAIREANGLTDDNIFVGQELTIPREGTAAPPPGGTATPAPGATQPPSPTQPPGGTTQPPPGGGNVYVVESGDTPLGIALQFGLTLEELEAANGGPLGVLQIGQEIILP